MKEFAFQFDIKMFFVVLLWHKKFGSRERM